MPNRNGVELRRHICQTSSGVVGILVMAYADGDTEEAALAAGRPG